MAELASYDDGAKVLSASSFDHDHDPQNIIDNDRETFWMSTGLFPQEMIIKLSKPGIVEDISIKGVKLKEVIFLGSSNNNSTWEEFGHLELNDSDGIQMGTINAREYRDKMAFLKIKILGGWNDFCAIRSVNVAPA